MKQRFLTKLMVAALLICAVPATLLAQDDNKIKDKEKSKPKKQQIIITRTGDETGKTVIEIDGDKVKINGKDAADLKDVNVRVNNLRGAGAFSVGPNDFAFNFDMDHPTLFKIDSNRAMLGVVTDGNDKGAEIQSVTKESAAEKAGLKRGDIITKIDNRKIEATDDVTDAVRSHKPGDKISITYLRDDKEQKTTAELGRWKGMNMATMVAPKVLTDQMWRENMNGRNFERVFPNIQGGVYTAGRARLGMQVQDTDEGKGVKVIDVDDEGSADKAGIKEGDIITQVDGQAVNSADEIAKLMREKREQPFVKLQINRNGKTETVNVRMKEPKKVDL
jgi:serine protease Do